MKDRIPTNSVQILKGEGYDIDYKIKNLHLGCKKNNIKGENLWISL